MSIERWIRLIAGTFIVGSVVLSYIQSPYWLFFTLFVGLNLFQSALTRWCLMEGILRKLGVGREAIPPARIHTARTQS
jgi:Inner membrane protein YgaP-like, transmembrane domain